MNSISAHTRLIEQRRRDATFPVTTWLDTKG